MFRRSATLLPACPPQVPHRFPAQPPEHGYVTAAARHRHGAGQRLIDLRRRELILRVEVGIVLERRRRLSARGRADFAGGGLAQPAPRLVSSLMIEGCADYCWRCCADSVPAVVVARPASNAAPIHFRCIL